MKYIVVQKLKEGWTLRAKEMLNQKTLDNANTKGVHIVSKTEVLDAILHLTYPTKEAANQRAKEHGLKPISIQSLRSR